MMNSMEEPAVRKGFVLLTRMESITAYKNQHGQNGPGTQEQSDTPVSANDICALITKKRNAKENSNPNLQSTPSRTSSKSGTVGTRQSLIAPNTLIQASTQNSRIFRALEQNN